MGENQISDISPLKGLTAITGLDVSNQMIILSSVDYIAGKPLQLKIRWYLVMVNYFHR